MPLQCEPDCCTRPVLSQERDAVPMRGSDTTATSCIPQEPGDMYTPSPTLQVPAAPPVYTPTHIPQLPAAPPVLQASQPPLRRSDRAGRGVTSRYDDFVQQILFTEPTYQDQPPAGIYNTRYPYDLTFFSNNTAGHQIQIPYYYPIPSNETAMINNLNSSYLFVQPT